MAWKIYAIAVAVIALGAPAVLLSSNPTVFDYIDIFASVIASLGLIGFAFHRAIGTEVLWRVIVPVLFVWEMSYNVVLRVFGLAQQGIGIDMGISDWAAAIALYVPTYVGLFLYAFRRHQLWEPVRA